MMRLAVVVFLCLVTSLLPRSATADGPRDLLILKGNVEIGFGQPIPIDPLLVEKLTAAGWRVTEARDFQPLTPEVLRRFACVIWVNPSPYASAFRYYMPASWQGGLHMRTVEANAAILREYVKNGGGLLINLAIEEIGMSVSESHQQLLAPYGLGTECAQVRDKQHAVEFDKVLNTYPRYMHWTEAIAEHPVTEGVERIYYPGYTMRWDDNVTTLPLYPQDDAWIPLVKAEPTATISWFRGTPYEQGHWKDAEDRPQPTLVAARDFGEGRVAVAAIGHFFLYYFPYSKGGHMQGNSHWEANFGFQDGYVLEKGDGETPSDMGRLLLNLYGWLAEPGQEKALGGYGAGGEPELAAIPEVPVDNVAAYWAQRDPLVTGPIRPMKILVGARSAISDGHGSPAEWAAVAKTAGIDVVAFTERYEELNLAGWEAYVAACREASDDEVHLMPGFDVADSLGNRFLIIGKESLIRPHLLVEKEADEPGRTLVWTGHLLLGMGDVLPVAARPERLASVREHGALPHELYSHVPGIAVATYDANGKQVDNGRPAFEWHVFNATHPIPVAVHELTAPEQLAMPRTGAMYSYVNSDTAAHAAHFFRQGHGSFGGNPMRFYISSGPTFDHASLGPWDQSPWRLRIAGRSDVPVTHVTVMDQHGAQAERSIYRHYMPNATEFDVTAYGDLGAQHWFVTEVTDAEGGVALLGGIRTLPERHFIRCGDRQNWFGQLHLSMINYTGRVQSLPKTGFNPSVQLPGVALPAHHAPKLHLTYAGPGYVVTEYVVDSTLVPGGRATGADSSPIFNALPIKEFEAVYRSIFHMPPGPRAVTPQFVIQEISVTAKANIPIQGDVWPIIGQVGKEHDGDHPAGTLLGNLLLLTPMRVDTDGRLGWPAKGGVTDVNEQYTAQVMPIHTGDDQLAARLASMGIGGELPYTLSLSQGEHLGTEVVTRLRAENQGIVASIKGGELPGWWRGKVTHIPMRIEGLSDAWPQGVWYADSGEVVPFGQLGLMGGLARLDVTTDRDVYIGNLLMADSIGVHIAFAAPWTADGGKAEIHNPQADDITTTVRTPAAVTDRKPLEQEVTVPAGSSIIIAW